MKTLKKLFLSTTTMMMTAFAANPAQANKPSLTQVFYPKLYAAQLAEQQKKKQQNSLSFLTQTPAPLFTIPSEDSRTKQKKSSRIKIASSQEWTTKPQAHKEITAPQAKAPDPYQILMQEIKGLKEETPKNIASLRGGIDRNHQLLLDEIATLKQEIKFLQAQAQEARIVEKSQVMMPALAEDKILLSREEFEDLNAQIRELTIRVQRLQESQHDLMSSVETLSAEKYDNDALIEFYSSVFQPINTFDDNEETLNPREIAEPRMIHSTFISEENATQQTTTIDIKDAEDTPTPFPDEEPPIVLSETPWTKEEFEQNVLGITPINLSSMSEDDTKLWRTFTVLQWTKETKKPDLLTSSTDRFSIPQQTEKPWSTFGGAFSTAELEAKFKRNPFMTRAFKDIVALHHSQPAPIFFENHALYFLSTVPNLELDPRDEDHAELIKAYYFRGLYRTLTGDNWTGRTRTSNAAKFEINLEEGIKGSRFNYGSLETPQLYETSLEDAEEYFKDTPWHILFINQVRQATLDSLTTHHRGIMDSYNKKAQEIEETLSFEDDSYAQAHLHLKEERELTLTQIKTMYGKINYAKSLQDIDDVLRIS